MIILRRLSGPQFALNPDLIERAEATPDTVVTMVNGNKYLVCESLVELTDAIRDHRARIIAMAEDMVVESDSDRVRTSGTQGSPHGSTHGIAHGLASATQRLHEVSSRDSNSDNAVVPIRTKEA